MKLIKLCLFIIFLSVLVFIVFFSCKNHPKELDIGEFCPIENFPYNTFFSDSKAVSIGDNIFVLHENFARNTKFYSIYNLEKQQVIKTGTIEGYSRLDILKLRNNEVFLFGWKKSEGNTKKELVPALIYSPSTDTFRKTVNIPYPCFVTAMTELSNGNILIAGGAGFSKKVLEYDVKNNKYIIHKDLQLGRIKPAILELEKNKILLIGGEAKRTISDDPIKNMSVPMSSEIEIYDLKNDTSETIDIGIVTTSGCRPKVFKLDDGRVLFFTTKVYEQNPSISTVYKRARDITRGRARISAKLYEKERHEVPFIGILKGNKVTEIIPCFDKSIKDYEIELINKNQILIAGGYCMHGHFNNRQTVSLSSVNVYDISKNKLYKSKSELKSTRKYYNTLFIHPNKVLIYNGFTDRSFDVPLPEILNLK